MKQDLQEQLVNDLLIESFEGLDRFDQDLLVLESGGGNSEVLNRIFRVIHTIKGTAGCLGFQKIEKVAHVGENLLSLLRENRLAISQEITSSLLTYADALREMLRCLESTRTEGTQDYTQLLDRLVALQNPDAAPKPAPAPAPAPVPAPAAPAPVAKPVWGLFDGPETTAPAAESCAAPEAKCGGGEESAAPAHTPVPAPSASTAPAAPAPSAPASAEAPAKGSISESAIRVDVAHLDRLMNLVGELVLARNQINQHLTATRDGSLQAVGQRLNLITTELQEGVMKTRMQPIDGVLNRFPRIVRDVAHELGKQVRLELAGRETELDRTIIESIKDPLTHVVRNSIDHGIESPEKRLAAGKSATGLLFIRAYHEGGQVNIEVSDDGAGINGARVRQKALDKGLISPEQAARLGDREAVNLIFLPGLSTAEKVTNVSGRGVGMDVVKTNIERIGGSVEILSELGQGTTIKFKIPLTLAIIPALIVSSGGERFAIPQVSLLELVRVESGVGSATIERVFDAPVYRLRGRLLPLVFLNEVLGLGRPGETPAGAYNIVVLQADSRQFGLVVDTVNDTEEIVVKPLGKQLKGITCFAGATIMGDGRVALILDVLGLAQHAAVRGENATPNAVAAAGAEAGEGETESVLLFEVGEDSRLAMPLAQASRLEEFPCRDLEQCGGRPVIQYRGAILPLIDVGERLGRRPTQSATDSLQVIVHTAAGRSVGLVVHRIVDIVEERLVRQQQGTAPGILGAALVRGRVTELLDVGGLIRTALPDEAHHN